MSHQIQFKKLVWEELYGGTYSTYRCSTIPFDFIIFPYDEGTFSFAAYSRNGLEIRVLLKTFEQAKTAAQEWFEAQLTQFIETHKNDAQ